MATPTNVEIWNGLRAKFPTFASHTSEGTKELFTERGYESLKASDAHALDDFLLLSAKVWLNFVDEMKAVDPLENQGFGESYDAPYGGIIQRMSVEPVTPVSPAYSNLHNFDSPDQYVVYKPKVSERFFRQNFDYASLITMPDDYHYKLIFTSENGMATYLESQIMNALQAGYTADKFLHKKEALNAYLNSTTHPIQDTQKYEWNATKGAETVDQLADFIVLVRNITDAMTYGPYTDAFNAMGHNNLQDKSRLKLLVRTGFTNKFLRARMIQPKPDESLALPLDVVYLDNFGGLEPYKDAEFTTPLYPVYDQLGHEVGFSTEKNAKPTYEDDDKTVVNGCTAGTYVEKKNVHYKDPNEGIAAIIADKGLVFEGRQNPYEIEAARNVRGRYHNLWASSPNNTVAVDAQYNAVIITENGQA